jgi:pyruvate-ferredoxin/flavodoxin oxidoreductase
MKDAATHSYLKKGQDIVDMNHKAIDLGATAFKKVEVPASWANAEDKPRPRSLEGRPATVKMVKDIMSPSDRMDGDSSACVRLPDHAGRPFELGASAYEKRGVAVTGPSWDAAKCIQCNNCAYVCPHATIRPFALTEEEAKAAPANAKLADIKAGKGKGTTSTPWPFLRWTAWAAACASAVPHQVPEDGPQEDQAAQQDVFDYCVSKVTARRRTSSTTPSRAASSASRMLEFSGSCAGCAETSYARLVTQLFGDHMYISNATGCSSIWGGPAGTSPYCTVNKNGKRPRMGKLPVRG